MTSGSNNQPQARPPPVSAPQVSYHHGYLIGTIVSDTSIVLGIFVLHIGASVDHKGRVITTGRGTRMDDTGSGIYIDSIFTCLYIVVVTPVMLCIHRPLVMLVKLHPPALSLPCPQVCWMCTPITTCPRFLLLDVREHCLCVLGGSILGWQ